MAEKIIVEMTREQAYAVMNATELLARLHIGQTRDIPFLLMDLGQDDFAEKRDLAELALQLAMKIMFGENQYGQPDIKEKDIQHERCWAVFSTIRHALSWHDHPEGNPWSVSFDEPMGYGEPMPTCKIVEEGDGDGQ